MGGETFRQTGKPYPFQPSHKVRIYAGNVKELANLTICCPSCGKRHKRTRLACPEGRITSLSIACPCSAGLQLEVYPPDVVSKFDDPWDQEGPVHALFLQNSSLTRAEVTAYCPVCGRQHDGADAAPYGRGLFFRGFECPCGALMTMLILPPGPRAADEAARNRLERLLAGGEVA